MIIHNASSAPIHRLRMFCIAAAAVPMLLLGMTPAAQASTPSDNVAAIAHAMHDGGAHVLLDSSLGPQNVAFSAAAAEALNEQIIASGHPIYIVDLPYNVLDTSTSTDQAARDLNLINVGKQFATDFGSDGIFVVYVGAEIGYTPMSNGRSQDVLQFAGNLPSRVTENATSLFTEAFYDMSLPHEQYQAGPELSKFIELLNDPGQTQVIDDGSPAYRSWMGLPPIAVQGPPTQVAAPRQTALTSVGGPQDAYPQKPSSSPPAGVGIATIFVVAGILPLLGAIFLTRRYFRRKTMRALQNTAKE